MATLHSHKTKNLSNQPFYFAGNLISGSGLGVFSIELCRAMGGYHHSVFRIHNPLKHPCQALTSLITQSPIQGFDYLEQGVGACYGIFVVLQRILV